MPDNDTLTVVQPRVIDILPDSPEPPLSATSERPQPPRPENAEAQALADADKAKATGDAKPEGEAQPTEQHKEDATPPEYKRVITREKNRRQTAEAALDALRQQVAEQQELLKRYVPDPKAPTNEPRQESYDDPQKYWADWAEWKAHTILDANRRDAEQKKQMDEARRLEREYMDRLLDAEEKEPGVMDLAKDPSMPISAAMGAAIMTSEQAPAILRYLDQHRDEGKKIQQMNPARAAAAIGRIEASLSAPKAVPRADPLPKPITPLGGTAPVAKTKYDPSLSSSDWQQMVNAEIQEKVAQMRGH